MPSVVFALAQEHYAISAEYVREMVVMPKVVSVSNAPAHIRGVINLRSAIIPVVDLRLRMGLDSSLMEIEDLLILLEEKERDHVNWLNELEASVREKRPFELAKDPHQCAFGKWYDNYQCDHRVLEGCLKQFDKPHKQIHAVSEKVEKLVQSEDFEGAKALIEAARTEELAKLQQLFEEARNLLQGDSREIALVLQWEGKRMAICVDSVSSVERFQEASIEDTKQVPYAMNSEFISGIAKREKENDLIQIVSVENLIGSEKRLDFEVSEEV